MDFEVRAWYMCQCHSPSLGPQLSQMHLSAIHKSRSRNFQLVAPRGVAKLSTSPVVTIFPPPVPYPFISDQCLEEQIR